MAYLQAIMVCLSVFWMTTFANAQIPSAQEINQKYEEAKQDAMGICPPINLLDERFLFQTCHAKAF
ncbi:MAG: hypothetical protein J7K32_00290 [Deltaproteobacteria bacterium]|uniref:hypothetical protein n=1 Tax=Desulfosarcina sp. BuS5 TaxID=933262 RepID=UPI0004800F11|nr:hypothetical protein [Desulfosarcina sp. BuS5]MCD6223959.1 hypothetical protein [Deltaproteobacteria bacterium]WDN87438.1 hypothetical protein BuS5_00406 [Desulfosarcina sp. BuS5]